MAVFGKLLLYQTAETQAQACELPHRGRVNVAKLDGILVGFRADDKLAGDFGAWGPNGSASSPREAWDTSLGPRKDEILAGDAVLGRRNVSRTQGRRVSAHRRFTDFTNI